MKVQVFDDDGSLMFESDDKAMTGMAPAVAQCAKVAAALHDATQIVTLNHAVIASIKADISAVIGRIEHELGAHPAFTWAQTKLGNAAAHLEHYVEGTWAQPVQALVPKGCAFDPRGVLVDMDPSCPKCQRKIDGSFICDQGTECGAPVGSGQVRRGS